MLKICTKFAQDSRDYKIISLALKFIIFRLIKYR
jgi:hypothetical protein